MADLILIVGVLFHRCRRVASEQASVGSIEIEHPGTPCRKPPDVDRVVVVKMRHEAVFKGDQIFEFLIGRHAVFARPQQRNGYPDGMAVLDQRRGSRDAEIKVNGSQVVAQFEKIMVPILAQEMLSFIDVGVGPRADPRCRRIEALRAGSLMSAFHPLQTLGRQRPLSTQSGHYARSTPAA